jgi:hypothetical protein
MWTSIAFNTSIPSLRVLANAFTATGYTSIFAMLTVWAFYIWLSFLFLNRLGIFFDPPLILL